MAIYTKDTVSNPLAKYRIVENNINNEFDIIVESERVYNTLMEDIGYLNESSEGGIKGFIKKVKDFFIWLARKIREMFTKFIGLFRSKIKDLENSINNLTNKSVNASANLIEGLSEKDSVYCVEGKIFPCCIEYDGYEFIEDFEKYSGSFYNSIKIVLYSSGTDDPLDFIDKIIEYDKKGEIYPDSLFKTNLEKFKWANSSEIYRVIRGKILFTQPINNDNEFEELLYKKLRGTEKKIQKRLNSIDDLKEELNKLINIGLGIRESINNLEDSIKKITKELDDFLKYGNYEFKNQRNESYVKESINKTSKIYTFVANTMNRVNNVYMNVAKEHLEQVKKEIEMIKDTKTRYNSMKESFLENYLESVVIK